MTKVTKNGNTSTSYSSSNHQQHTYTQPKIDHFELNAEEKEPEYAIRRMFYKAINEDDREKCRCLYELAKKNPKQGAKIFSPIEDDYSISLSMCFVYNSRGKVTRILENKFKILWLMHYNIWKFHPKRSITYVYADKSEREIAHNLGYDELLKFIDDHHIQDCIPIHYYKAYGSRLLGGDKNPDKGDYKVRLDVYGAPLECKYGITKLFPKNKYSKTTGGAGGASSSTSYSNNMSSTFNLFSDKDEPSTA